MQAFARAMLEGECWNTEVSQKVGVKVDGDFRSIEGCELSDSGSGNANATTDGSNAQAVRAACSATCCRQYTRCRALIMTVGHNVHQLV